MFRCSAGDPLTDQIRFMAENGFLSLEDLELKRRDPSIQNQIRTEIDRHGMKMGLFTGSAEFGLSTFASGRADLRAKTLREIRESVDVARRMNAKWFSIVPGKSDSRLPKRVQTAHAVESLKRAAEICERSEVVMLLEPLHPGSRSPELFLQSLPHAARMCRLVNSPACRVLFDVYEQSFHFENLFAAIDRYWDVIGYFQIGDRPGRKEPGTGNIDFQTIHAGLRLQVFFLIQIHQNARLAVRRQLADGPVTAVIHDIKIPCVVETGAFRELNAGHI